LAGETLVAVRIENLETVIDNMDTEIDVVAYVVIVELEVQTNLKTENYYCLVTFFVK
jgi:hypothetical protein